MKILSKLPKIGSRCHSSWLWLLSENLRFAERCEEEGIIFVGPKTHHLDILAIKLKAKEAAVAAGIASIPGSDGPVATVEEVVALVKHMAFLS